MAKATSRALKNMSLKTTKLWLLEIENSTTKFSLLPKKSNNKKTEVAGIFLNGFQVNLPKNSCSKGQLLTFSLVLHSETQISKMSATGKVFSIEDFSGLWQITIEFKEYEKKIWQQWIKKLEERQNHANLLFESIRGKS